MPDRADLLLVNARVVAADPQLATAEAVAVRNGRIAAIGTWADLRRLAGPDTTLLDAEGGLAVPAFHDAHLHLLSYARNRSALDCRDARSIQALVAVVAEHTRSVPGTGWVRAVGYDESEFPERRHPDRHDLDSAAPDRPVRLQHRTLHLDVLNTAALRELGVAGVAGPAVERDPLTGEPTGRVFNAGELLRAHRHRGDAEDLSNDVWAVSDHLLSLGVTSVQDASATNGGEEWDLLQRLVEAGSLRVRLFFLPGVRHFGELAHGRPGSDLLRRGPVKIMVDELTADPVEVRADVAAARNVGQAVAIHAVSEAEVAVALDALRSAGKPTSDAPDRLEHGAVIPDAWLDELRALRVVVVGQPGLVYERGDHYRAEYSSAVHGWLHRARSLLDAGVPYAIGSDAPVTEAAPGLAFFAATRRLTRSGAVLGRAEALTPSQALAAMSEAPARAVGAAGELGRIRPGAAADIAVLDPEAFDTQRSAPVGRQARATIMQGRVVWRRPSGSADPTRVPRA